MRIVVNHLTRMQPGFFCAAGVDLDSSRHVRPVIPGRLSTHLLTPNRGPFGLGTVVELGRVSAVGRPPEVEDYRFNTHAARCVDELDARAFWDLIQGLAQESLPTLFGEGLRFVGRSAVVEVGSGVAPLGCLRLAAKPRLYITGKGGVRLQGKTLDLSVSDLRFYEADHQTPRPALVRRVAGRIAAGERVILAMGLTRPFSKGEGEPERHWLQVNNIFLEGDPLRLHNG